MPSHVYFEGMCSLCLKAGLVSLIVPIAVASISKEFKSNEREKTTPAREKLIVITHYRSKKRFALIRKLNLMLTCLSMDVYCALELRLRRG
jgi:hypothetical protein